MLSKGIWAKENVNQQKQKTSTVLKTAASSCSPATSQTDLEINNVRATILAGGDMWWDLLSAQYEIPKGSGKTSLFSGALWIGGIDKGQNLKVAAMTYRQTGNDFWPGPLDTATASTSSTICSEYDRHWKLNRSDVEDWLAGKAAMPEAVSSWPATGHDGAMHYLAPFYDANGDTYYDPLDGDYPGFDLGGDANAKQGELFGDQNLYWIFNDNGNIHSETGGEPIGLEIHAQAFAFTTNDQVNNMTFYQYTIINRGTSTLDSTYFGQWVDPDLGNYLDDYVGCDVKRGLGYCYNGDNNDDGVYGYGLNPPAVGVDFFQGPIADANDGIDNDRDGEMDEEGEDIIMSKFVYYNNDDNDNGNPRATKDYYNYLKGVWRNGSQMTYGSDGMGTGTNCNFMFPGETDTSFADTWTEQTSGNKAGDRRFLQSAGPFTLEPGAINTITVGVVWAQASQGGPFASVNQLLLADDKAQTLFNNNFKLIDGPDAPDAKIVELDQQLVLILQNTKDVEEYVDSAKDADNNTIHYAYQGYQIYQLVDASVSASELDNPDKAVLIDQVDEEDDVSQIVNGYFDPVVNQYNYVEEVNGENVGIKHSFSITTDQFAQGNNTLVNFKQYHFMVVSYAFSRDSGVYEPYLAGRKNIEVYTGIPHKSSPENNGTIVQANYGTGPKLKRIEGHGNGNLALDFAQETVDEIMSGDPWRSLNPVYDNGAGPMDIKVIDPLNVPKGNFTVYLDGISDTSKWHIAYENETAIDADTSISVSNEQVIENWGLSINATQTVNPGDEPELSNGFISASMEFANGATPWITGVPDEDGQTYLNWIRSGLYNDKNGIDFTWDDWFSGSYKTPTFLDPTEAYENLLGKTIAPYRLCSKEVYGPAYSTSINSNKLSALASVNIVLTSDPSKWTRCMVMEMCDDPILSEGGIKKFRPRSGSSVDVNGNIDNSGTGMGWFPGYAINLETGERLNIIFGENSWFTGDNGGDMIWNPSANILTGTQSDLLLGGEHYVYVMNSRYDEDDTYMTNIKADDINGPVNMLKEAMWVWLPLKIDGQEWLSSDVKIKLRVSKSYTTCYTDVKDDCADNPENNNYPLYTFNTNDIYTIKENLTAAQSALDSIRVVPNPYYAYSDYETTQLDNRVKITNLPEKCTITIMTSGGRIIRTLKKDNTDTYLDWDLKNSANISVSGGMYIIHISAEGIGEGNVNWLGVMRPVDLDSY